MPRKKTIPPAETPENRPMSPAPEAEAPEAPPAPPDPLQAPEEAPAPPAPEAAPEPVPEPPEAAPETPPGPDGFPAIVTAAKGLNFRAGPGFGFDVLGVVELGTLLLVLDLPMGVKVPGWALVWLGQTAAWVSDKHLRLLAD